MRSRGPFSLAAKLNERLISGVWTEIGSFWRAQSEGQSDAQNKKALVRVRGRGLESSFSTNLNKISRVTQANHIFRFLPVSYPAYNIFIQTKVQR